MPRAPATERLAGPGPEDIATEYAAAVAEAARSRRPDRQEFLRGVVATLDWVWNGSEMPPIDIDVQSADAGRMIGRC